MSLDTLLGLHSQGSQARPQSTMGYLEGLFGDSLQSYLPGGGQASPAFNPSEFSGDGLHPLLVRLQNRLPWLDINSGHRSTEHQRELWEEALRKYGDPEIADNWVARPGTSNHEDGTAIDVAKEDINRLLNWLSNHQRFDDRIGRPMSWEPWHFEVM